MVQHCTGEADGKNVYDAKLKPGAVQRCTVGSKFRCCGPPCGMIMLKRLFSLERSSHLDCPRPRAGDGVTSEWVLGRSFEAWRYSQLTCRPCLK
jgi:hypothetical protein